MLRQYSYRYRPQHSSSWWSKTITAMPVDPAAQPDTEQASARPTDRPSQQTPLGRSAAAEGVYAPQGRRPRSYGPELDPPQLPQRMPGTGRSPWRPRGALSTQFHVEEEDISTMRAVRLSWRFDGEAHLQTHVSGQMLVGCHWQRTFVRSRALHDLPKLPLKGGMPSQSGLTWIHDPARSTRQRARA